MDKCSICIFPAHLPGIKLDENGVCNYCNTFFELHGKYRQKKPKEDLINYFKKKKKKKRKYDCMVGLSGGKDSTYVLYLAVKELNLNVLAYTFDNCFRSEDAVRNVNNAVEILGCDHVLHKPNPKLMYSLMKKFIMKAGEFCTPCLMGMDAASEYIAKKFDIDIILSGHSWRISTSVDGMSIAKYYDRLYYMSVINSEIPILQLEGLCKESYLKKGVKRALGLGTEVINIYDYYDIQFEEIHKILEKELGWVNPRDELQHGDCILDNLKDHLQFRKWGCSELTGYYSSLVRNKAMSREEAIKRAEEEERSIEPRELSYFLKKTGITYEEFNYAINNNHFTGIPNLSQSKLFNLAKSTINSLRVYRRK